MSKLFIWVLFLVTLGSVGWYWYDRQPKSYTVLVPLSTANKDLYFPEDACEPVRQKADNERIGQICELAGVRRINTEDIEVDVFCKTPGGCFICKISCK
ncbi:MAG: hypothetical protein AAB367_03450 [Patescibacteria group bacterium]